MKYRLEYEIELEPLTPEELEQHAWEMEIKVDEIDLSPPSAEWLEQQVTDNLFGHHEIDGLLFDGSDVYFRLARATAIRVERLPDDEQP